MGQSHCSYQPLHYDYQNFDIIFSGGRPKRPKCKLINKECHVAHNLEFKRTSLDFSCMCRGMGNLHMLCAFLYKWQFLTTPLLSPTIDVYHGDFSYTNDTPYLSNISCTGKFSANFNLKNMILTFYKELLWKKWSKFTKFWRKFFYLQDFYDKF
jgi:hypothetical protein